MLRVQIPPFAYIDGKKYRVRGVAHFAFENCELLEEVSIPDGWIAVTESAFVRCPSLKKVELGSPVDTLRVHAGVVQHAFVGCENLRELTCTDEKATVMLLGTFSHNEALRNAELPAGFCVDSACFASCTMLEKATLHKKDCLTRGYVFHNCVSLRHVEIPTDNISVSIGDYTFFNCKKLERIRIPARTKNICRSAFEKCASLGEITLPKSIEYIDPTAFADCTALKEVTVEGNVNDMLSAPIGTLYLDEIFRHATKFYAARPLPPQAFRGKFVAAPSDKRGYDLYIKEEPHGIL